MAKADSLITLRGTHGGLTFVKSPTYGDHVRAARGTHKKAKVNAAFKKQSKKLMKANVPAQILRNAINPYRRDFYYGPLSWELVSMTNEALGTDGKLDFANLKPFEINPKYPLSRLFNLQTATKVDGVKSTLKVTLSSEGPPTFEDSLPLDGYRLQVIVIYPDLKNQTSKTDAVESTAIALTEKVGPLQVEFPIRRGATHFLICVRVDGLEKGKLCTALSAKGMRVMELGRIGGRRSAEKARG
jgi:hypothetical protein